jgi:hypothetical protein
MEAASMYYFCNKKGLSFFVIAHFLYVPEENKPNEKAACSPGLPVVFSLFGCVK